MVQPAQNAALLSALESPIVLKGDARTAYRDPAALYHNGAFHLFFSYVRQEENDLIYWYTAVCKSADLRHWSSPRPITPKDQNLNFSSPGNVVRFGGEWVLCLQTYPIAGFRRGDKLRFGDERARLFTMRSRDLEHWREPQLLRVKGPDVAQADMGKMIDPYLIEDKDTPGQWWCFYKQSGQIFLSTSFDLETWRPGAEPIAGGENPCVILDERAGEYVLFYAPRNGVGVKRSSDLRNWRSVGEPLTLGQAGWPWAGTRLTAGFVADWRAVPGVGRYVMFFHGMAPGTKANDANVQSNCPIGIAWSDDLTNWSWPGAPS